MILALAFVPARKGILKKTIKVIMQLHKMSLGGVKFDRNSLLSFFGINTEVLVYR